MRFTKTNPHPTGKKIGDCVIRAIVLAEKRDWVEVYDRLVAIGRELHDMPNSKNVYEKYLLDRGWKKEKMPRYLTGKRYKLKELADIHDNETIIVSIAKHIATVINGELVDTWDCSNKCVGNYFTKN